MKRTNTELWERFQKNYSVYPTIDLALDISRMNFGDDFFGRMDPAMQKAFSFMDGLEKGTIANPDEQRMVGHYWLRNPEMAPTSEIRNAIQTSLSKIQTFTDKVHRGEIRGERLPFKSILLIGIGGSALGPQFVSAALGHPQKDKMRIYFFDNTDPDGIDTVIAGIEELGETLCVVISKSGGTKETRNGMLEAKAAYEKKGLNFGRHVVAVTGEGSELDKLAQKESWIERFEMWDWVGGRTSELSAVGLLPASLQGISISEMLTGARACDEVTRGKNIDENPSALLALMWFYVGNGKGQKDMVVLPYKDRLALFSKYLQQLLMESLGKEKDLKGNLVNQGIAVYGNKGSTDQHSYIQQLRDGINNFFATFIEVLEDRIYPSIQVDPNVTSGDYLQGFLLGTRQALYENDRESISIIIRKVCPFSIGMLIALFERAVGFYASLININAYHQPGVESGKKAAAKVIELQLKIITFLQAQPNVGSTITQIAEGIGLPESSESIFKICEHLSANVDRRIQRKAGASPFDATYIFA
ncbi:MAG: glucose-6-phosphate isomerase [Verrucomicrobiota bacterium]